MALSVIWRNFITFKSTIIMIKKGCLFVLLALCVSVGFAQKSDSVAKKRIKVFILNCWELPLQSEFLTIRG